MIAATNMYIPGAKVSVPMADIVVKPRSRRTDLKAKIGHLQRLLVEYAHYRSYNSLQEYIKEGGNVNVQITASHTLTTPLCVASQHYDYCAMDTLFRSNCDINFQDGFGNTPLFQAAKSHKSGSVSLLLKRGAEPDIVNKWGNTPLTVALENFSHHCAELLVNSGASVNVPIKSWSLQRHLPSYIKDTVSPLLFVLLSSPSPFPVASKLVLAGALVEELPEDLVYNLLSRPGICVKFVKLLINAGFRFHSRKWSKELKMDLDLGTIADKNRELFELTETMKSKPSDLQCLCRVTIRKQVVMNRRHKSHLKLKLEQLALPKSIVAFLKLEDF